MATRQFDNINVIKASYSDKIKRLEKYFGEMELPEDEIEERIYVADALDVFLNRLFVVIAAAIATSNTLADIEREYYYSYAANGYAETLRELGYSDLADKLDSQISETTKSIVDTTFNHSSTDYYTSSERAIFLAMDESNAVMNYDREMKAIQQGYTKKTWITMFDEKVRNTHKDLHEKRISINDTFLVGKYDMRFPLDISMGAGPEEVCNCRCVCKYSK